MNRKTRRDLISVFRTNSFFFTAMITTCAAPPLAVLVVDDLDDAADSLRELLALSGFEARSAGSLAEAEAVLRAFRPDVAIVDLWLSDGSGFTLAEELSRRPDAPLLIAVSGVPGQAERCRAAGFAHYIEKPATPADLVALLRHHRTE